MHTLASLQLSGVPAVQVPLWQVSSPLQTLVSAHEEPLGTGVFWQPRAGPQVSVVHTLLSLQLRGVPGVQVPLWQVSAPLQTSLSAHGVPLGTGVFWQPRAGSQVSVVHALESLQLSGVPAVQVPLWQVSSPLQTLVSAHEEPLGTGVCWQASTGSQVSVVHTLESLQLSGVPAVHVPLWQVSAPLQTVLSAQGVPLPTGVFWQPRAGSQVSVVHALLSLQLSGVPGVQVPL